MVSLASHLNPDRIETAFIVRIAYRSKQVAAPRQLQAINCQPGLMPRVGLPFAQQTALPDR